MSEWIRKIRYRIAYWLASDWIDDLETRLSEFLWYQTGGRMSKSYYTVQAMISEADAFRMQECDECEYRRTTEGGLKDAALQQLSLLRCRHEAIGDVGHIHQEMQAERQTYSASILERF